MKSSELILSLTEWQAAEFALLFRFVSYWREQSLLRPYEYPMSMDIGEWNEQFVWWLETVEKV